MQPKDEFVIGSPLEARIFTVPEPDGTQGRAFARGKPRIWLGLSALRSRAKFVAEVIDAEGCDVVVACTGGDLLDIPAAYHAARTTRSRCIPYYFDYWSQQAWVNTHERRIAELIERWILPRSANVIVPNSALANELEARYGVTCSTVPNACESPKVVVGVEESTPHPSPCIMYTGAVYDANLDCFQNLIAALDLIPTNLTVKLYTAQTPEALKVHGLTDAFEVHPHRTPAEIYALQRRADILFLPLGFNTPYSRLIRTSSPAKMCEYLWSGRPILVHAPSDTFVASYFREHGCGLVVDQNDPALLAAALTRLLENATLRSRVVGAAHVRAFADCGLDRARALFASAVGLDS